MENQEQQSSNSKGEDVIKQIKGSLPSIPATVVKVITNPAGFYREMPKTGGFITPLIFMIAMGVVGGLLRAVLSVIGLNPMGGFGIAIASVILVPIFVAIFGFISAAIVYIIWKVIGSKESYETAYRCVAYAGAIVPITTVLNVIPYVGSILGLVWITYLMVVASTEVHQIVAKKAWIVFGTVCAVLSLMMLGAEFAGRRMASEMKNWEKEMGKKMKDFENMTPGEAGEAIGEFMKGFEKSQKK